MGLEFASSYMKSYIVKIIIGARYGTGFYSGDYPSGNFVYIATAYHVVEEAEMSELPITFFHAVSGVTVVIPYDELYIFSDKATDSAVIVVRVGRIPFPPIRHKLSESLQLLVASEVFWMGFPKIAPDIICFFSGRISASFTDFHAYLIDGVSVNGVSGGPVMCVDPVFGLTVVGVVTHYVHNDSDGLVRPGLVFAPDITSVNAMVKLIGGYNASK